MYDLSGKFRAAPEEAAMLLRAVRAHATPISLSFHVGSQCLDPLAYRRAIALPGETIRVAGVKVDVLDVGGGFPVRYPDIEPPPPGAFFAEIETGVEALGLRAPALGRTRPRGVAGGTSVVVQVQSRRGDTLYVKDDVYGSLSDAGAPGFRFPVRPITARADAGTVDPGCPTAYVLFGPTCDSADARKGPLTPATVAEDDWIEIGQFGTCGACRRTAFNGFDQAVLVEVCDQPMLRAPEDESFALAA